MRGVRKGIGLILLLLAIAQFGFRGMQRVRSDIPLWDFVSVHSAVRTWIHGGNPYDLPAVITTWRESGIFTDRDASYFATVYPPTSLLMLVPLAMLPANAAMGIWLILTLVLLAGQFWALKQIVGWEWREPRVLILIGAALASAPMQFGILSGQLSLPAISLCAIAIWLAMTRRQMLAGVLLGIACGIKPQVAGPVVAYYVLVRRFKVAVPGIITGSAILAISLAAMWLSHIDWLNGWRFSIAQTTALGAVNDYGWANRFRDEIVDLKLLLVRPGQNPGLLRGMVAGVSLALAAWYLIAIQRARQWRGRDELISLAALSAVLLLPVYHRVYDIALLSTALAWALAELDSPRRRYAWGLLAPMLLFLIPFDIVKSVGNRVPHLAEMARTWWWQSYIAPHYAWGLILLTIVLLVTLTWLRSETPEPSHPEAGSGLEDLTE